MYVCGPTVYDVPHLGHGRFTLVFDVLRRYLEFRGLDVRYVSNITDIDDHIITRASEEGRSEAEVSAQYEAVWWEAMDALGVKRPTEAPHATAFVEDMVGLIGALVDRGVAYETTDGVYLSVDRIEGYGLLARQSLQSLRSGARVEPGEEKRSPLDFVLWKKARPGEPTWASPWGPGRPGWHTECVVMSLDLLGEGFDLHGGGMDLAFPHHENERAQAVGVGHAFARHWVHNGWVMVEGEKMSKSLGNFTSLTDLLERADARAYRLLVLRAHYRSPIEVTPATVDQAEKALTRLDDLARRFDLPALPVGVTAESAVDRRSRRRRGGVVRRAHGRRPRHPRGARRDLRPGPGGAPGGRGRRSRRRPAPGPHGGGVVRRASGLELGGSEPGLDAETTALVVERDRARGSGRYDRADAIRHELEAKGWVVEDGPEGTRLHRRTGS